MDRESQYRIAVIIGSVSPGNFTAKSTALVVDEVTQLGVGIDLRPD